MDERFYIETYGCSLNASDTDLITSLLRDLGAERVNHVEDADVVFINTCGVKTPTEDKIIHRLEELSGCVKPVVVVGCLPRIHLTRVTAAIPSYAAILGPQSLDVLEDVFQRVVNGERGIVSLTSGPASKLEFLRTTAPGVIYTIPICEGCLGACTYCAVRFARGPVRSYSIDRLRQVAERSVHLGYKEIRLTAQDTGAFGSDTGEDLVGLLRTLDGIPGVHRFRLGMFNVNLVERLLPDMLDVMRSSHFFRFFHIPVQSGSDAILRAMNRRYTSLEWERVVHAIRAALPDATIATDVIVGFPGETDSDFELTLSILKRATPDVVNISKYGDRPGTEASKSDRKVKTATKKERGRVVSDLVSHMSIEAAKRWIGWTGPVLITSATADGVSFGRTPSYRPITLDESLEPGKTVNAQIVDARRTHLIGTVQDRA
ncbi:MAG: tRNA (N(6)-L-threonylcarbamoyladenosine(37)-C(2))-methylthiotransferase [Candidatus Thorarchaeota archaeon]|nr:tRNA (N(6)-L-threonylcarbamoyladenosine(37)-C(2))-methylthiotransferase [Candidatus Thorarchaeota archaeon]